MIWSQIAGVTAKIVVSGERESGEECVVKRQAFHVCSYIGM
jgi:hypothetical protein